MRPSLWKCAALASLLVPAVVAADPASVSSMARTDLGITSFTTSPASGPAAPSLSLATPFAGGVRYRPRGQYRDRRDWSMPTWTQLHAGFYEPSDNFGTGFVGGLRIGPMVDPHIQLGLSMDWWHRSIAETEDLGSVPLPGGDGTAEIELSRSSADLVPVMAFIQVGGDEDMAVIPYAGVGVGYEWLFLSADFPDGSEFDETFGGFGWQAWGGIGVPLSGRTRLNGEVFYNGSEPENDDFVTEFGDPATVRVKMSGVGARFGLSWGF